MFASWKERKINKKEVGFCPYLKKRSCFAEKGDEEKQLFGGSPGVVVMGEDWCSRGCEFKSQHRILDGHFFTFICCKICIALGHLKTSFLNELKLELFKMWANPSLFFDYRILSTVFCTLLEWKLWWSTAWPVQIEAQSRYCSSTIYTWKLTFLEKLNINVTFRRALHSCAH